ncbi:MAG: hypothetical protein AAGG44_17425, partial [Planctomycetota bacterium]
WLSKDMENLIRVIYFWSEMKTRKQATGLMRPGVSTFWRHRFQNVGHVPNVVATESRHEGLPVRRCVQYIGVGIESDEYQG